MNRNIPTQAALMVAALFMLPLAAQAQTMNGLADAAARLGK